MNLNYGNKKTETIGRDFIDNVNQIKEKLYYDKKIIKIKLNN